MAYTTPASDRQPAQTPTPNYASNTPTTPFLDPPSPPETPPPEGLHGDIEMELVALATALYNLGTAVINDNSREKPGPDGKKPEKRIAARVNEVVEHLAAIDEMSQGLDTLVPLQVLADVDNGKNPMQLTRDRIERAALENQFINGKLDAIQSYVTLLDEALATNFPELRPYLENDGSPVDGNLNHGSGDAGL